MTPPDGLRRDFGDGASLAEVIAARRGRDFAFLFRNQYVLTAESGRSFPGLNRTAMQGWALHHGKALRLAALRSPDGSQIGFLLGHALTGDSALVETALELPANPAAPDFAARTEAVLTELSGRYLAIVLTERVKRAYTDMSSAIPLLFDQSRCTIGSSLGLMLDRRLDPNPQFSALEVVRGRMALGLGHTLDRAVKRGISNHYLDLETFAQHRFWPRPDAELTDADGDAAEIADRMMTRLGAHMRTWATRFDCIFPITGGRDSRILLAAAMPVVGRMAELSGYRFHNPSRIDTKRAREVLAPLNLPYKQYFRKAPRHAEMADMRLKMGWSGYRYELNALPMMEDYPLDQLVLRGGVLEATRANQWQPDALGRPLQLPIAVRRLRLTKGDDQAAAEEWGPAFLEWLETQPQAIRHRAYDLAHVDLWMPNTGGAFYNGFHRNTLLDPFNDRALFFDTLRISPRMRKSGQFVRELVASRHPELLEQPFH
ncbi:MAG: hypothetical protein AAF667_09740 [Pseudomonadota bacterium]